MNEELGALLVPPYFSKCHCAQLVVMWCLGDSDTGSALASMGGLYMFSRGLTWAPQSFPLHFPFPDQLFHGFLPIPLYILGLLCFGFGLECAWGGLLVEPLLSPLYSFLLLELLWVPLLLTGKVGSLLAGWILGVAQSLLPPGENA